MKNFYVHLKEKTSICQILECESQDLSLERFVIDMTMNASN